MPKQIPTSSTPTADEVELGQKIFPIVGIGASAGGLDAFRRLLSNIHSNTGMTFVIIQHLSPHQNSLLSEILSKTTSMPVHEVSDRMMVAPNQVYVIPSNSSMGIEKGRLRLYPRRKQEIPYLPIDFFLRSLANYQGNAAIGVILSGTGSDGAEGLKFLKNSGGITFAQSPESAQFEGMPANAINLEHVDYILPPEGIASELLRIADHPYLKTSSEVIQEFSISEEVRDLKNILQLVTHLSKINFEDYKQKTLFRRIMRRIALHKIKTMSLYTDFLQNNPAEVMILSNDLLINVTAFFRDPGLFKKLQRVVFPSLLEKVRLVGVIRVWVAGCSTGEECYSLAISLLEFFIEKKIHPKIQIFATDLSEQCVNIARIGRYPESIKEFISPELLKKYFIKIENGFQVQKIVREVCIFAKHNVISDPPFSQLDIISCRNLLIYLLPATQHRVLTKFHFSLLQNGFLLLGASESTNTTPGRFKTIESKEKIFMVSKSNKEKEKENLNKRITTNFPVISQYATNSGFKYSSRDLNEIERETDRFIACRYAPPSIVINENLEIIQFRGDTSPFLVNPTGRASFHVLKMAREGLATEIKSAILLAKKNHSVVTRDNLKILQGEKYKTFTLEVVPIHNHLEPNFLLLLFKDILNVNEQNTQSNVSIHDQQSLTKDENSSIAELTLERNSTRSYLESLNRDLENINQDLQSANEEVMSSNEELQSANEELETAKEELESANEELNTINIELNSKNTELDRVNNDLINFLESVDIPILIISSDGLIRRLTPSAQRVLHLVPSDVGRPIRDFKSRFDFLNLELDLEKQVYETAYKKETTELEVQDRQGHWYRLQIKPYRTSDHRIDGALVTIVDIDSLKTNLEKIGLARKESEMAREEAEKSNRAKDLFFATLSHELRTPMTAIVLWSQMLLSGKLNEAKTKHGIETILENCKVQIKLIEDLLDVSRIILGKVSIKFHEIVLVEVVQKAIDMIRGIAEEKEIKIEGNFDYDFGTVMGDPTRLLQVFGNLLNNSVKFSPRGSNIVVHLEQIKTTDLINAKIVVKVIDHGQGIQDEFLPHVFDHFSQQDLSNTRTNEGLGLGLAIVKSLIELHGGKVEVESFGLDQGTTFTIILPLKNTTSRTRANRDKIIEGEVTQSIPSAAGLLGLRILIVEDEKTSRDAILQLLRTQSADVKAASNAQEAIELFKSFRPDILVSDIAMPGENGYTLIKKIRKIEKEESKKEGKARPFVPAIALTAYAGLDEMNKAISSSFQAHLAKPFEIDALSAIILRLVGKK